MAEPKHRILIVEDDLDVADMLNAYFRVQGYDVVVVNWGEDGVRAAQSVDPQLVILDIRLPDIDGFEVARRLRTARKTSDIPIIFLTEKRERTDRLQGLELGADDYITKPFDVQELRLRVRNALQRAAQDTLTNPVTNLPEGQLVEEKLSACLHSPGCGLMQVSLMNLDTFREHYGFVASDDVLRAISLMIQNVLSEVGSGEKFLGHLSATDYVMIVPEGAIPHLEERVRSRLEQSLDYFYPIKDREQISSSRERIFVQIATLRAADGSFASVDQIKAELAARRKN